MRALVRLGLFLLCLGLAFSAWAKKHKNAPVRSNPGGASQKWSCEQIAENACDIAKRCEPDKSLRRCRKLRERCNGVKERNSRSATEDDVTVCGRAIADLPCKQVSFDNTSGVVFEMKKLEACTAVAADNPLPAAGKASNDDDDDDKPAEKPEKHEAPPEKAEKPSKKPSDDADDDK